MKPTVNRRKLLQAGLAVPLAGLAGPLTSAGQAPEPGRSSRRIRVGIIGMGGRGKMFLRASLQHEDVDVTALCDIKPQAAALGEKMVQDVRGNKPALYTSGPQDYRRLLEREDVDAVFITTPAPLHGRMAIDSLRADKWVFSEVPACYTLDECWEMVEAAQNSKGKYFLAENYCLFRPNMLVLNMVDQGLFGEITFAECGYIHDCRNIMFDKSGELTWRGRMAIDSQLTGNTYPTHSLGPVSTWLGITRGERFTRCVSMATKARARKQWTRSKFGPDSPQAQIDGWQADSVSSMLQTESGILVVVRKDSASPRPHRMGMYTLQGTRGAYDDQSGLYLEGKSKGWQPAAEFYDQHDHPWWRKQKEQATKAGHGGGDHFTVQHFYDCMRSGRQPIFDVYDAVTWSALIELSQRSVDEGGAPQEYPDFTAGEWKKRPRHQWPELA